MATTKAMIDAMPVLLEDAELKEVRTRHVRGGRLRVRIDVEVSGDRYQRFLESTLSRSEAAVA